MGPLFNMEGGFNDVSLTLAPGANEAEVIGRLDKILEPYGGLGAYSRADQISHRFLTDEIAQDRVFFIIGRRFQRQRAARHLDHVLDLLRGHFQGIGQLFDAGVTPQALFGWSPISSSSVPPERICSCVIQHLFHICPFSVADWM